LSIEDNFFNGTRRKEKSTSLTIHGKRKYIKYDVTTKCTSRTTTKTSIKRIIIATNTLNSKIALIQDVEEDVEETQVFFNTP
jgi:hypothetical protein